jgi:hypothetical protein
VAVLEADLEHAVPQGLDDLALHLDLFFLQLLCDLLLLSVSTSGRARLGSGRGARVLA